MQIEKVKKKLGDMVKRDQEALKKDVNGESEDFKKINKENCDEFRKIVRHFGLIDIERFGEEASFNAWLLIQHFPKSSVKFKEKYLMMMRLQKYKVNKRNLAYLEDRVAVETGKPQKYGTQGRRKRNSKQWHFYPIIDIENIDKKRAAVGLDSLAEYAGLMEYGTDNQVQMPEGYKKEKIPFKD